MKSKTTITLAILFLIFGFTIRKKHYTKKYAPPGTMLLTPDSVFLDETEVRNLDWIEYTWWTQRVYGKNSNEYKNCLPDTTVWGKLSADLKYLDTSYFRNKQYRDYPIVGISYEQAITFCKWRSDRVFEYTLIAEGILDWNMNYDASNCFTIERYFKGEYKNLKPNPNFFHYPEYRLPTKEEWTKAYNYNASKKAGNTNVQYNLTEKGKLPLLPVFMESHTNGKRKIKSVYYNISGNVSEYCLTLNETLGGSILDHYLEQNNKTQLHDAPNAFTGFRAACEWKKWK